MSIGRGFESSYIRKEPANQTALVTAANVGAPGLYVRQMKKKYGVFLYYWLVFGVAYFLLATSRGFVNPGGPYISKLHTILPTVLLGITLCVMLYRYRSASMTQRVFRLAHMGLALTIGFLIWSDVWALLQNPRLRGSLFGP